MKNWGFVDIYLIIDNKNVTIIGPSNQNGICLKCPDPQPRTHGTSETGSPTVAVELRTSRKHQIVRDVKEKE